MYIYMYVQDLRAQESEFTWSLLRWFYMME